MLDHIHIRLLKYQVLTVTPNGWNYRNLQDSFWRFYVHNRDGAMIEPVNQETMALKKDRMYFIPAGVRFHVRTTCDVREFFAHFDVIGLPQIAQKELFNMPICLPDYSALAEHAQALQEQILDQKSANLVLQMRCKALLYEGLALYLQGLSNEQIERSLQLARAQEQVLPAISHIEEHLAEQLLSRDLARLCHMNVDHFTRRFRSSVGQTPGQYIQEQRVKMAAQHLVFTDQSIEQIAASTGFGNRFYFSRVFARHTGVTPAAYRTSTR